MPSFEASDSLYTARIRESFARQTVMQTIGARLGTILPGEVEIELPYSDRLSQQNGFLHAGVVTTIVDSACGYAALSLLPAGFDVLAVEFKINFLAPAVGENLIANGRVLKSGRKISVCHGRVTAEQAAGRKLIAAMQATVMNMGGQTGENS